MLADDLILYQILRYKNIPDTIKYIRGDVELRKRFYDYVNSGQYFVNNIGGVDVSLLPDLEAAIPQYNPERGIMEFDPYSGYPEVYHAILDMYYYGVLDTLPGQVKQMVRETFMYIRMINENEDEDETIEEILPLEHDVRMKAIVLSVMSDMINASMDTSKETEILAIKMNPDVYMALSPELRHDPDIISYMIKRLARGKEYVSLASPLNDMKEVVVPLLMEGRMSYSSLSDRLQNDIDVAVIAISAGHTRVTLSVTNDPRVRKEIQDYNRDMPSKPYMWGTGPVTAIYHDWASALKALKKDTYTYGGVYNYVSERLMNDKEFILAAVRTVPYIYSRVSEQLRNDRDVAMAASNTDPAVLRNVPEHFLDREMVINAVSRKSYVYRDLSDEYQQDRDIVIAMVTNDMSSIIHIPEHFLDDNDILMASMTQLMKALYD